jgi:hypothetical protein
MYSASCVPLYTVSRQKSRIVQSLDNKREREREAGSSDYEGKKAKNLLVRRKRGTSPRNTTLVIDNISYTTSPHGTYCLEGGLC